MQSESSQFFVFAVLASLISAVLFSATLHEVVAHFTASLVAMFLLRFFTQEAEGDKYE